MAQVCSLVGLTLSLIPFFLGVSFVQLYTTGGATGNLRQLGNLRVKAPTNYQQQKTDDNVLVVISSDRVDGILPVIASILRTASAPVDVVLIGGDDDDDDHGITARVQSHFGNRIHELIGLTVEDVKNDLEQQGLVPIWTWDEWHSSIDTDDWVNENTIRRGEWDNRDVHAHELNHLRFYLPHMSIFQDRKSLYFVDDDILVQSDLATMATETLANLDSSKGFVSPCNVWKWNSDCHKFRFSNQEETIMTTTPIYGDREVCQSETETDCVPESYHNFLQTFLPNDTSAERQQMAWNFGFSLFALQNWRDLQLTEKYEAVMKESYRLHVFPETSLTFGLGVAFIAFAGAVECWNEDKVKVRDGFAFIDHARFEETFGEDYLSSFDVLHYTGSAKPWEANTTIGVKTLEPWLNILKEESLPIPLQLPPEGSANQLFTVLGSEQSEADRVMLALDSHPQICAPGEHNNPEIGFPTDVMRPDGHSWFPTCSIKRGCSYAFVRDSVMELTSNLAANDHLSGRVPRCQQDHILASANQQHNDPLDRHLERMCNFVDELKGDFSPSAIARVWVDAYKNEDKRLLECGCKRGATVKGVHVNPNWLLPKGFPHEHTESPQLELDHTALVGSKVIRMKRRDLWSRVKLRLIAEATQIWDDPQTEEEKEAQLQALPGDLQVDIGDLKRRIEELKQVDAAADEWAVAHASEVLWVEYEDCKDNTELCLARFAEFLNVDRSYFETANTVESVFSSLAPDNSLAFIANKEEVQSFLNEFTESESPTKTGI